MARDEKGRIKQGESAVFDLISIQGIFCFPADYPRFLDPRSGDIAAQTG